MCVSIGEMSDAAWEPTINFVGGFEPHMAIATSCHPTTDAENLVQAESASVAVPVLATPGFDRAFEPHRKRGGKGKTIASQSSGNAAAVPRWARDVDVSIMLGLGGERVLINRGAPPPNASAFSHSV